MLLHVPELLTPEELASLQHALESARWTDGRLTAGSQAASVKHNEQVAADDPRLPTLQALVLAALQRHPLLYSAALPKRVLPPMFNRYAGAANHYGDHVDQAIRYVPGTRTAMRTDISCTLFLADPAAYDGGELVIETAFGPQRVKCAAGDAVIYPGTSVHRVEPVTRGTRLASFFWIESLVRSQEQRRLLFDMDLALMRLRERHGENADTVALTGTYHNLLRQWAET